MAQSNNRSRARNTGIGLGIAALLLAAFGCNYFYGKGKVEYPGDRVNVSAKKIEVPKGFDEVFKDFTGLLLVDKEGKVTAITTKGDPIDLCGSGSGKDCQVVLTTYALVDALSGSRRCGRCTANDELYTCHKDKQKYPCHTGTDHQNCVCR
jgi:hypothetical protein